MFILTFRFKKIDPDTVERPIRFVVGAAKKQPKLVPQDRVNAIIALHVTSIKPQLDGPYPGKA